MGGAGGLCARSGYAAAADAIARFDNSEIDQDSRAQFVQFDNAQFKAKFEADLAQQMPHLSNGVSLTPAEVQEMVEAGILTQAEAEQMLKETDSSDSAPKNGQAAGEVQKDEKGNIFTVLETTGEQNDVEYIRTGNGLKFLHVEPTAEGFTAQAIVFGDDVNYKETLSGPWNMIQ